MRASRIFLLAALLVAAISGPGEAQQFARRTLNIDYYLLRYFNRLSPLPRSINGDYENHYAALSLVGPHFGFVNHDVDFLSPSRSTQSAGMAGSGVAVVSGAGALIMNPAGLAAGESNEVYFAAGVRSGSGESTITDHLLLPTGVIGDIQPLTAAVEPRFLSSQGGLFLAGRPFFSPQRREGVSGVLGRTTLAAGYRRWLEVNNGTDALTDMLPEGGLEGFAAPIRVATQSREEGGVDATVFALGTGFGDRDAPISLRVGAAASLISGRVRADQVFTVSQLTQIVLDLPGALADDSFVEQKFEGTAVDLGFQASLHGDDLLIGGTYRPSHVLEMRRGKYLVVESGIASGSPTGIVLTQGTIADYDLHFPSLLHVGGSARLAPVIGDGVGHQGILGFVHRFFGRGVVSFDYSRTELSETFVVQREDSLRNPAIEEDIVWQNLGLAYSDIYGTVDGEGYLRSTMPLPDGNALLQDKSSFHIGMDTPIFDRPDFQLNLRLGYERVPLAFPSLVLGEERLVPGTEDEFERPVRRNADGTPVLEDLEGSAVAAGLGYKSGRVGFEVAFRTLSYDYVTWWGGTELASWYNPLTPDGHYEYIPLGEGVDEEALISGQEVSQRLNSILLSATLEF